MSLRGKIVEAMKAELRRQAADSDGAMPHVFDLVEAGENPAMVSIDGEINLESLADAALEARKRWHRATDPSAK